MDFALVRNGACYRAFCRYMTQELVHTIPFWVWFIACSFALIVQCGCVLGMAPLLTGFIAWLSARLKGEPSFPITSRWRDIWHYCHRPSVHDAFQNLNRLFICCAFVLMVSGGVFIPVFTLTVKGFPVPNLLLICSVLIGAMLMLVLSLATQGYASAIKVSRRILGEGILLPALVPVFFLSRGHDLRTFLTKIYTLSPLTNGVAYVLAGLAVCVVGIFSIDEGADHGEYDGAVLPLTGFEKGLWLLTFDCIRVYWLTLAVDIAWVTSLAVPMDVLGDVSVSQWLDQCVEGMGLWVCKLSVVSLGLVGIRFVATSSTRIMQIRGGSVFLLGVLAWQMAYAYVP